MKSTGFLIAALICTGCATSPDVQPTTIDMLLANSTAHDERVVQIRGAVVARFEATYVCPSLEQIDSQRTKVCLWLKPGLVGEGIGPGGLHHLHRKWVVMVGKFDAGFTGHGGAYGASIVPITVEIVGRHGKGDIPTVPEPSPGTSPG